MVRPMTTRHFDTPPDLDAIQGHGDNLVPPLLVGTPRGSSLK